MSQCAHELLTSTMYSLMKRRLFTMQISAFASGAKFRRDTFRHEDLEIHRATPSQLRQKPDPNEPLLFGHKFADHMIKINWNAKDGWTHPIICPIDNLQFHPAAKVLQYGIQLFEGMKAYRCVNDEIILFRPEKNIERMNRTAARAALPEFSIKEMIKILCELVKLDRDWIPKAPGSLYIRPSFMGIDPVLGVAHSQEALLYVITCPVGQYYPTGFKPVTLYADPKFCRAFPGGVGSFKMGCNYAPTMLVSKMAQERGCQQVLWLFGKDRLITEAGAMNIFIFWKNENGEDELVTAPLSDGIILPGVVRDSLLHFAREKNDFKVSERYVSIDDIRKAIKEGRMCEMFGTGTACVVAPVSRIMYKYGDNNDLETLEIPTMTHQPNVMQKFYNKILAIQNGTTKEPGWTITV